MSGPRLLLVDDEPQIHRFLRPSLAAAGFEVIGAMTGAEALHQAASRPPALILLDLGLPDLDGQELLARLRAFTSAPVIVLSARDRSEEKITALDAGADDYVEKPFDVGELLARIRAALRRGGGAERPPRPYRAGGLEIEPGGRKVTLISQEIAQEIALTARERALLAMLARNAGRVVTHRQLLTAVWGPAHTEDVQYLRVYIGHLRQKLREAGRLIATEPGVGYRLLEEPGAGQD